MMQLSDYNILEKIKLRADDLLFRAEKRTDGSKVLLKILDNSRIIPGTIPFGNAFKIAQIVSEKGIAKYLQLETFFSGFAAVIENINGIPLEAFVKTNDRDVDVLLKIAISIA